MPSTARHALCAASLLGTIACGGPTFVRDVAVAPYKPLPAGAIVRIVPNVTDLPPPVEVLGELVVVSKQGEADRPQVEKHFQDMARRIGCDVIAEVAVADDPQQTTRVVKIADAKGNLVTTQEPVLKHRWAWHGRCVRTAGAGLRPQANQPAAVVPIEPTAEPKPVPPVTPPAVRDLSERLDRYTNSYLRGWRDRLRATHPAPGDVTEAFAELMADITGPNGLWRKTVPQQWLQCSEAPDSEACLALAAATQNFRHLEILRATLGDLSRAQAATWLQKHHKTLVGYLDTYVPDAPGLAGAQATPFFKMQVQ